MFSDSSAGYIDRHCKDVKNYKWLSFSQYRSLKSTNSFPITIPLPTWNILCLHEWVELYCKKCVTHHLWIQIASSAPVTAAILPWSLSEVPQSRCMPPRSRCPMTIRDIFCLRRRSTSTVYSEVHSCLPCQGGRQAAFATQHRTKAMNQAPSLPTILTLHIH